MEGCTIMNSQTKAEACFYYYKELNEELLRRYNNNTMYVLNKNDNAKKTLQFMAHHADCILIADTFIGRRFFNIADRFDAFYEFTDFLDKYDFKICKVQIFIRCDLGFQALLIAIS